MDLPSSDVDGDGGDDRPAADLPRPAAGVGAAETHPIYWTWRDLLQRDDDSESLKE